MSKIIFDFTGENYIVTGASSGMGKQIALELVQAGAKVLAIARRLPELEKLRELYPENIFFAAIDVCDKAAVQSQVDAFVAQNGKVNGFVHAAGIDGFTSIKTYDDAEAHKIMEISFWAGISIIQILHKRKYTLDNSSFVMFSSISALHGERGLFAYSAAKAAISAAVQAIAKEINGRGLRINAVCPGHVKTPMTEKNPNESIISRQILGEGMPEDVSGVVLFLLSDRSRWITGTNVIVDGGYLAN